MVSSCPRIRKKLPLGRRCSLAFTIREIVAPNAGEIAALHRTVNIHHAPDVVVRDRFHFIASVDRRHVGEYLWTNHSRSTDGNVLQIRQRLNCVLRRLRHKAIVHAVLLVQKEDGCGLETAAERNQQIGRAHV